MDIRISQTWSKIGIETQNAKLELNNNGEIDYKISHTEPKVKIDSTLPKVHIDQSNCFAEEGLKGIKDFSAECLQIARQKMLEYIEMKAQQGDSFAMIENKGKPVLDAIKQESTKTVDFNVGAVPKSRPDITVEEGELNIELIRGEVNTEHNNVPIDINYYPYSIKFYLLQKGSVDIEYIGQNVDTKI